MPGPYTSVAMLLKLEVSCALLEGKQFIGKVNTQLQMSQKQKYRLPIQKKLEHLKLLYCQYCHFMHRILFFK